MVITVLNFKATVQLKF